MLSGFSFEVSNNPPDGLSIMSPGEKLFNFAEEIAKRCTADQINHRNFKGETSLHMACYAGLG